MGGLGQSSRRRQRLGPLALILNQGPAGNGGWDGEAPSLKHACACRIKSKKENQRRVEEQRMQEAADQREPSPGEGACETLAQLKLEERGVKEIKEKQQRNKEYVRYGRIPSPHRAGCYWQR